MQQGYTLRQQRSNLPTKFFPFCSSELINQELITLQFHFAKQPRKKWDPRNSVSSQKSLYGQSRVSTIGKKVSREERAP